MLKNVFMFFCLGILLAGQDQCESQDADGDEWEACSAGQMSGCDCDDADASVHPGAEEICDGVDTDCSSSTDSGQVGGDAVCAGSSCSNILQENANANDGSYWIQPDVERDAFEVWCDMTTDGGGWTLIGKTDGYFGAGVFTWIDVLDYNYFRTSDLSISQEVPDSYLDMPFFALLAATAAMNFQDVMIQDSYSTYVQSMASTRTMRVIHDEDGVEPLYTAGVNTGVLLLLGNAAHTGMFPCYYPAISGQTCETWYDGDGGSTATAFYIGDLAACQSGPYGGQNLTASLWGSGDCYSDNSNGGYGGFTYYRPIHASTGQGAYVNSGYNSGGWALYYR